MNKGANIIPCPSHSNLFDACPYKTNTEMHPSVNADNLSILPV